MFKQQSFRQMSISRILPPLALAVILIIFIGTVPTNAQPILEAGKRHVVSPTDTECLEIEIVEPENAPLPTAVAECDTATGVADVAADDGLSFRNVRVVASSAFQFVFSVSDEGSGGAPSFVPINVVVPTQWAARLINGHFIELQGNASLDIFVQLRQDPDPDANMGGERGKVLVREPIVGASHGGVSGCLTLPTDPVSISLAAIGCLASFVQRVQGGGNVSLDAVVEVGRGYNLELVMTARAESNLTTPQNPARVTARSFPVVPDRPGLKWTEMIVTIGTDPAALVAELQEQIDQLREDLENHTHNYQTGPGVGHNNTQAISSPAIIPGDAAQGQTANQLRSGPTTGRHSR